MSDVRPEQHEKQAQLDHQLGADWAIREFVGRVESLAEALPVTISSLDSELGARRRELDELVKRNGRPTREPDHFTLGQQAYLEIEPIARRTGRYYRALQIMPSTFLVSLVSQFDGYLGKLLRALFSARPELVNGSERQLTYKNLCAFRTMEEAREFIAAKEVESLIRRSHADQFRWLEERFGVRLRADLPAWPSFIEITERRNQFVHNYGVASDQYLQVCNENKVPIPEGLSQGADLSCDSRYFNQACECVLEVGIKLGHVLWRSCVPDDRARADARFNSVCIRLLKEERFALAMALLRFAAQMPQPSSDEARKIFVVNLAQSHKWSGDDQQCLTTLNAEDWSACAEKFKLGAAVLRDDFPEAANLMRKIGSAGDPDALAYGDWPMFKEFRKSAEFATAYKEVFGPAAYDENFGVRSIERLSAPSEISPEAQE